MEKTNCTHHFICGDRIVESHFPDFFKGRKPTPPHLELQVCRKCGAEKSVKLFEPDRALENVVASHRVLRDSDARMERSNGHKHEVAVMEEAKTSKVCVGCGLEKSLEDFQRRQGSQERFDRCKKCVQAPRMVREAAKKETTEMPASTNGHVSTVDLDDGPVVKDESFEVKYNDALEVIKHQQIVIDNVTVRLMETLQDLADANRRARLVEIDMQMFKLEAERAQLLDHFDEPVRVA